MAHSKGPDSQHTRLAVFDFDGPAALLELGFIDADTETAPDRGRMKAAQGMAKEQMKVMQKVAGPMAMPKSHGGGLGFAKK